VSPASNRIRGLILANLRASPVKSVILLAGAVVLVFLVVRQVGGGAESADAAVVVALAPAVADGVGVDEAPRPVAPVELRPLPRVRQTLRRNLFKCSWMGASAAAGTESVKGDEEFDELVLQFTMKGANGGGPATAVISGVVVHPGSAVAEYEVVSIGARHVLLRSATEDITLRMP